MSIFTVAINDERYVYNSDGWKRISGVRHLDMNTILQVDIQEGLIQLLCPMEIWTQTEAFITFLESGWKFYGDSLIVKIKPRGKNEFNGLFAIGPGVRQIAFCYLKLDFTEVKLAPSCGGFVGQNCVECSFTECHAKGTLSRKNGGICGSYAESTFINCSFRGDMARESGGIVGSHARSKFINCHSEGLKITSSGGICGSHAGDCEITNCYSIGEIVDKSGGICGIYAGETGQCDIENCFSKGNISSSSGGICGAYAREHCVIDRCYSTGDINDSTGIAGYCSVHTRIKRCYTTGSITGHFGRGIVDTLEKCVVEDCLVLGTNDSPNHSYFYHKGNGVFSKDGAEFTIEQVIEQLNKIERIWTIPTTLYGSYFE